MLDDRGGVGRHANGAGGRNDQCGQARGIGQALRGDVPKLDKSVIERSCSHGRSPVGNNSVGSHRLIGWSLVPSPPHGITAVSSMGNLAGGKGTRAREAAANRVAACMARRYVRPLAPGGKNVRR